MQRLTMIAMAAALTLSLAGVASAYPCGPCANPRLARQELRIRQGARAGQLGRGELRRLRAHQRHLRRMELRARADGRIGARERIRLDRAMDRQSCRIWRARHNGSVI